MRKTAVFIMALCMASAAAGCHKKDDSPSADDPALIVAEAPAPEEKPVPEGAVLCGAFEYSVSGDLSAAPTMDDTYYPKGRDDISCMVYAEKLQTACSLECYNDFMCRAVLPEGVCRSGVFEEIGGRKMSVITLDTAKLNVEDGIRTSYTLLYGNEAISVTAFYKQENEAEALSMAKEIISTAEYVGRQGEPDMSTENEYFAFSGSPEWRCESGMNCELTVKYAQAEDIAHYASYFSVGLSDTESYEVGDDAKIYAQRRYEELTEGPFAAICTSVDGITETEIFGLKCYKMTAAVQNLNYGDCISEMYIFEKDGEVMEVNIRAYKYEGYETVLDQLRGLIERIDVK